LVRRRPRAETRSSLHGASFAENENPAHARTLPQGDGRAGPTLDCGSVGCQRDLIRDLRLA